MPLTTAAVGRRTEPVSAVADRSWVSCFAAALGSPWPRWLADDADGGQEAHPLFPVAPEWPVVLAANTLVPELDRDELARGVHASHRMVLGRPIVPGEALVTTATVGGVSAAPSGGRQVLVLETATPDGEVLARTEMGSAFLGVEVAGAGDGVPPAEFVPRVRVEDGEPALVDVVRHLDAGVAYAYSACSRIWNPIHTDPAVAAAAGLPGPIVHGTAMLGMAVSEALLALDGGPGAWSVDELTCRFVGMVVPPADIRVVVSAPGVMDGPVEVRFEVRSVGDDPARPTPVAVAGTLTAHPR